MSHDLEKIATDLSESIFTRIEQDRCLIKQTIADVIHRELVFRFGRETPESHAADRCSCGNPADDMVNLNGQSACWDCIRKAAAGSTVITMTGLEEATKPMLSGRALLTEQARELKRQVFRSYVEHFERTSGNNGGWNVS